MNKKNISLSSPAPSVFDLNGSDLDERMFVVVIFPVSFVAMPIPIVMAMPVFVIPIVVPAVLVSSDREPRFQLLTRGRGWIKAMSSFSIFETPWRD